MPTPLISDADRALLLRVADYLDGYDSAGRYVGYEEGNYIENEDAAVALLRRLAVKPDVGDAVWFAQGEPNEYVLMKDGDWLASVKFNGELVPAWQEATLRAWLGQPPAPTPPAANNQSTIEAALAVVRLNGLRRLCGYVENGNHTPVGIYQNDATSEWIVRVGGIASPYVKYFVGSSMLSALDAAIAGTPEE